MATLDAAAPAAKATTLTAARATKRVTIDAATLAAVKGTKREVHEGLSHKRQLARTSSKKRATLATTAAKRQADIDVIGARQSAASSVIAEKQQVRSGNIGAARSQVRRDRVVGAVTSTATPSSNSGIVMTTIFVIAGLIIMYMVVTNPGPTTGWLGTLGTSLHALSSNKPLFTATAK